MKLPGGEEAVVDVAKLRDYCLSTDHVRGRHKARVFAAVLGLTSADSEFLRRELLRAAQEEDAVASDIDEYGARYTIDVKLSGGGRCAVVRTTWIVLKDETIPRLTSCYVLLN
jgi:hypothetical protein